MRYNKYLKESDSTDIYSLLANISKNCKPFLKEWLPVYKKTGTFLYRGTDTRDYFGTKTVRTNRIPMSTPEELHNEIDDLMYDMYGIHGRSKSIFCTFNPDDAGGYGDIMLVFPIGNFKYLWSKDYEDLYISLARLSNNNDGFDMKAYISRRISQDGKDKNTKVLRKMVSGYRTDNLYGAYKSESEIMVQCHQYYYISYEMERTVEDYFNNL